MNVDDIIKSLRKTRLCKYYPDCRNGDNCSFAHGDDELTLRPCWYGNNCRKKGCTFSHPDFGTDEKEFPSLPLTKPSNVWFSKAPVQQPSSIWKKYMQTSKSSTEDHQKIPSHDQIEEKILQTLKDCGVPHATVTVNIYIFNDEKSE